MSIRGKPTDRGFDHLAHDAVVNLWRRHGCRRVGAHPTSVGAMVAVIAAFVVLRRGKRQHIPTVRHHDEAQFLTRKKLLDDDFPAGGSKLTCEHRPDGCECLFRRFRDDHALAGGEATRLDDDRSALSPHILGVEVLTREGRVGRGRNTMPTQEFLRIGLGAFQLRRAPARTETSQALSAELIDDSRDEGRFGSDDREVDTLGLDEGDEACEVVGADLHIANVPLRSRACVAWSDQYFRDARGRCALPRKRVFATARTDDKDLHVSDGSDACP